MTSRDDRRLADIARAIEAIHSHVTRGDLSDGLIFDAIRIRLLEIGEAVKALSEQTTAWEPSVHWHEIARMRDHLAHRYFDTNHPVVQATIENDIPVVEAAVDRLRNNSAER